VEKVTLDRSHIYKSNENKIYTAIEMFSAKLFILFYLFQTISGQSNSYGTSCTCIQTSSTGSFCWQWTCQTNQLNSIKFFARDATVEIVEKNNVNR